MLYNIISNNVIIKIQTSCNKINAKPLPAKLILIQIEGFQILKQSLSLNFVLNIIKVT